MKERLACILCGRLASFVAIWFPTPSAALSMGIAPGAARAIPYAVCARHRKRKYLPEVEAKITARERCERGFVPERN
jgi:hypothetical protein